MEKKYKIDYIALMVTLLLFILFCRCIYGIFFEQNVKAELPALLLAIATMVASTAIFKEDISY